MVSPATRTDGLEAAKWIAIVLMSANHLMLALGGSWPEIGHLVGRPCVALFATILATRLASGPPARRAGRAGRAFGRLALWGLIALPIYYALVGRLVIRVDILLTLAAGVGLVWLIEKRLWAPAALAVAAVIAAGRWLDGGALSALAVPVGFVIWRLSQVEPWAPERARRRARLLRALTPVTVAGVAAAANLVSAPDLPWAAALVFLAPLILGLTRGLSERWPTLPGVAFYAFYPAHLLLILLVLGPLG